MSKVKITLYKWEGKFFPFEIKSNCGECSLNKNIINSVIEEFEEKDEIEFIEKPWLTNWYKVLFKGGYHAPIVFVNRKIIEQEKVLTREKLKDAIIKELYKDYKITNGVHIYTLPNCKFCKLAKSIFKNKNINFIEHNILDDSSEMMKFLILVKGKIHPITVPQIFINKTWIKGAEELQKLEKNNELNKLLKCLI